MHLYSPPKMSFSAKAATTICLVWIAFFLQSLGAQSANPQPQPVPRLQAVPLPYDQVSFQRDGAEIARYHFGPALRRPFMFPVIGPSGRPLTRMGHPHDPDGHSHHNSVWISHHDVNRIDFWGDGGAGRIVHQRVEKLEDGEKAASVQTLNSWLNGRDRVLLSDRRRYRVQALAAKEWLLIIDLQLSALAQDVTLGKTPFGFTGVRMAKTIGVRDGGGRILNSDGKINEEGVFWKPARWVDYSGATAEGVDEGITLMDHPSNPNHPSVFHVRDDGWMGASFTFRGPRTLAAGETLSLRYGLYIHRGAPSVDELDARWQQFAASEAEPLTPPRR